MKPPNLIIRFDRGALQLFLARTRNPELEGVSYGNAGSVRRVNALDYLPAGLQPVGFGIPLAIELLGAFLTTAVSVAKPPSFLPLTFAGEPPTLLDRCHF